MPETAEGQSHQAYRERRKWQANKTKECQGLDAEPIEKERLQLQANRWPGQEGDHGSTGQRWAVSEGTITA